MTAQPIRLHAVTHLPGGSDPLPVGIMYPTAYDLLRYDAFKWGQDTPAGTGFLGATLDNTYPFGFYVAATANGADFIEYVRLGPLGSKWALFVGAEQGPDCGILSAEFQVIPENDPGHGYNLDGENLIAGSFDAPGRTFYTLSGSPFQIDLYNAVQNKGYWPGLYDSQWRIMGADGAAITGNGVGSGPDNAREFPGGGSGIWAIHFYVNGKNASSSGYKVRLTSLKLVRLTGEDFATS